MRAKDAGGVALDGSSSERASRKETAQEEERAKERREGREGGRGRRGGRGHDQQGRTREAPKTGLSVREAQAYRMRAGRESRAELGKLELPMPPAEG